MGVLSLQTGAGLTCNHPRLGGIIWISWRIYEENLSVLGGSQVSMSTPCVCLTNPREVYPLGTWMESNSFFRMAFFNGFLLTLHEVCRFHKRLLPCWRHQGELLNYHEVFHGFFIIMVDVLGSAKDMVDSPGAVVVEASIGNVMECFAGCWLGLGVGTLSLLYVPSQYPTLVRGHWHYEYFLFILTSQNLSSANAVVGSLVGVSTRNTMKQWWIKGSGCGWGYHWHFTPNVKVSLESLFVFLCETGRSWDSPCMWCGNSGSPTQFAHVAGNTVYMC